MYILFAYKAKENSGLFWVCGNDLFFIILQLDTQIVYRTTYAKVN